MVDFSHSSYLAKFLFDRCNELMSIRPRYTSKEEFAKIVLQNIFGDPSIDLLLLRPLVDTLHADALNRLNALVGFESTVFMTIYANDALFNEFIEIFCNHVQRSTANEYDAMESIYMWLLSQYLQYLLPIDEQKLSLLKNSNWLTGPLSSLPASTVTSPRRLLRPEVLAASSPLEHISLRSGSFRTLYPRLLQFVGTLLDHLASLTNWPSVAQFQVLKVVLNHYNEFLLCELEDSEFSSLKLLLLRKPLFTNLLHNFLERLLKNWPLGSSYCLLIEIWIGQITPQPIMFSRCSEEKHRLYIESTLCFVDLIDVQIRRLLNAGCKQILCESPVLNFLKEQVFRKEPILALFCHRNISAVTYLMAILTKFDDYNVAIHAKLNQIKTGRNDSIWMWLFEWIFRITYKPPVDLGMLEREIHELKELIDWLMGNREFSRSHDVSKTIVSEIDQRSANTILLRQLEPDHAIDPWTKMLFLTPHGRIQVINRQARFDYARYSKQISDTFPTIGFWDIGPLARFLHQLSIRCTNSWLVHYLRQHGRDSMITRFAAKTLLSGPSPPKFVPVFARLVPKHEARLKLRMLANLPVLICALFFVLILVTFIYYFF